MRPARAGLRHPPGIRPALSGHARRRLLLVRCRLMRVCLLALLLLMALGLESWPDARLALGFALARGSWLGILA